ncbi:hypothetical protein DFH07DRAFT_983862 [Mycena maculata]|uniref:WDR59/RTC1-like RING zinc finger domain-containing protein n=1 Tax=Mycena maculata TaxID=230809 RepID=A0AAD7IAY4_9AGAR|nr:hypothetical protein DFH07DRAFT_983862 [Mycena maculata]
MPRWTAEDSPSQTPRPRVSSSTSIVNFAPPPLGRRPSWTVAAMPDLSGRRPSWTPALEGSTSVNLKGKQRIAHLPTEEEGSGSGSGSGSDSLLAGNEGGEGAGTGGGESSEETSNLRTGMQIDMKTLVGDAVGNMSISPTSRDVVLAARRGLFIIDLESPLSVPRFLPQGGTWDVADVQWNPHTSRAEYIVSTSAEKLLIWNLHLSAPSPAGAQTQSQSPSAIQHVLHAHYRAITDINWHPAAAERDIVVSTGVDAWVWAWDLRAARGGRAVFGLSAFNAGGTQVKWNRQDPHVLASSHAGEVLIWDRRHGSLPTARLRAHRSKIYGIDWSPSAVGGLVTCALDGDIKVWDVSTLGEEKGERSGLYGANPAGTDAWACAACTDPHDALFPPAHGSGAHTHTPARTIRTANPVWRARHLPFGRGLLSLPQRGGTGLGMYALGGTAGAEQDAEDGRAREREREDGEMGERDREWEGADGDEPVEVFEGHTDVVKEFVWRRGGDGTTFQLITWSKDRTLRFWPVDPETMQKVGYVRPPEPLLGTAPSTPPAPTFSFRNPPPPPLDALPGTDTPGAGVTSPTLPTLSAPVGTRTILAGVRAGPGAPRAGATQAAAQGRGRDERAPGMGLLFERVRTVPVGSARMSRGTVSGRRMGMDALTWLSNVKEVAGAGGGGDGGNAGAGRSSSGGRGGGAGSSGGVSEFERGESIVRRRSDSRGRVLLEEGQSLQDELTSVINKLVAARIKLEKHDLTKKRTCTLGLHGPWGESSSVFIRITFTFPKDYPHGLHPRGTPTVELERNPLISLKNRAFILRRLRAIRERQRPCLEACLRFLSEGAKSGAPHPDSESSSDEEHVRKSRDFTVSLLRTHKNLAEPRTSQGTFGPNGELVCFFRAPPRIVRHVLRDLSISASPAKTVSDIPTTTHDSVDISADHPPPRVFRSPALIADAVRRLSLAATDRVVKPLDPRRPADGDHILRIMTNLLTFSHDTTHSRDSESSRLRGEDGGFRADSFAYPAPRRSTVFITNTTDISGADRKVAVGYVFEAETLAVLCQKNAEVAREHGRYDHERIFKILLALFPMLGNCLAAPNVLVVKMVTRLHAELCKVKDIQMLAMLSMIVLQGCRSMGSGANTKSPDLRGTPTPKYGGVDYFSLSRSSSGGNTGHMSPISPTWPRLTASPPLTSNQPVLSTSNSSRGSWSSLFNAGSMRQFMSGVQESLKDGLTTPSETPASISAIPVPKSDRIHRGPDSPLPRRRGYWRDAGLPSPTAVSKSWNDSSSLRMKHAVSFSSAGHRPPAFSRLNASKDAIHEARVVVYDMPVEQEYDAFPAAKKAEFVNHIHIYADLLFSWQLYHKRLELLKSVNHPDAVGEAAQHDLGLIRNCTNCNTIVEAGKNACPNCARFCGMPHCTVCRLPVKGLSRSCLRCFHVTHIACWRRLSVPSCPLGCGCVCDHRGSAHGAPLASLPPQPALITASRMSSKGAE